MRRSAVASFIGFLLFASPVLAYTSPGNPLGYVNDFAGVLSVDAKQSLETELAQYEKDTSNEVSVAIVPNLGGDYIENYAVKLFEEWGVGKADRDNGVLLLIAIEDREMRIEVGYGLEGALPDSLAQRILDDELTPKLREGDYDGAIRAGAQAIMAATKGEYAPRESSESSFGDFFRNNIELAFIGAIFFLQWLAAILGRSRPWWPGGALGIVAGLVIGLVFAFGIGTLGLILVMGLLGALFDYAVSSAYQKASRGGNRPPWWAGGSGTGGFGGSSRGGGFGGFGGGSSGGGGASGRW
jgi:uncharacterized protein